MDVLPEKYLKSQWAMPVKKNFEFDELFNLNMLKLRESGVQFEIFKKYGFKHKGNIECGTWHKGSAIGMKSVISAIMIMLGGIILPLIIYVVEIIIKKKT